MENFYKILGVRENASLSEIKRAYREKVKMYHPDSSGNLTHKDDFNKVVKAYRILSDARQKNIFDESFFTKIYKGTKQTNSFDYYTWLKERNDYESKAKFIFFTLMHSKEDEAVEEFIRMQKNHPDFSLKTWFTREDFMDYGYILAEELVIRSEYYDAFLLLEQIIKMEYSYSYFYIFFPEVLEFTLSILQKNIDKVISDELALDVYERALELNLGKKNDSFFLKKMSEEYQRLGDTNTAKLCLEASKNV